MHDRLLPLADGSPGRVDEDDDRTRTPLTQWFWAAYLVTTQTPGLSALQLQRQLGIRRYETAWTMLHKLRGAMVRPGREPLKDKVDRSAFIAAQDAGESMRRLAVDTWLSPGGPMGSGARDVTMERRASCWGGCCGAARPVATTPR